MEFSAKSKVRGGKLVYVKLSLDERRIGRIRILGDFFMYPESAIEVIEGSLVGKNVDDRHALLLAVEEAIGSCRAELIGVTPESIVETIRIAVRG